MFPIDQLPLILKSQTSLLLILFANIMITLALNFIVSVFAVNIMSESDTLSPLNTFHLLCKLKA
ncbi:hypothetical protein HanLR1_Chr13g0502601 [Helianthus annuus]|nr:hypothetical protein HanHA89_Chr13g0532521 [Helianthus annuus]KAJ0665313.1 hypothetical protein HanLR1_Chr13g0502601 [Helianthus annuus]